MVQYDDICDCESNTVINLPPCINYKISWNTEPNMPGSSSNKIVQNHSSNLFKKM